MEYIKKHKFTTIIIVVFVLLIIVLFLLYDLFFSNSGKPEYGNRLDGIENVEIIDSDINKIKNELSKNSKIKDTNINVSGKKLNIIITVDDKTSLKDAKSIGEVSYMSLNDKQIKFYSIQIFIKKTDETQNNFPIIGYKQNTATKVVWTKDRSVTSNEE